MRLKRAREAFTIRSFLLLSIVVVLLGFYINSFLNGESSIRVLNRLKSYEKELITQKHSLQKANQKLQKEYFELVKLSGY
jgi:hypothetical protein